MKKLNRRFILVSLLAILMMFSFASIVMAGNWVPASSLNKPGAIPVSGVKTIEPSGVIQWRDYKITFFSTLTIDGNPYNVMSVNTYDASYNPTTAVRIVNYDAIWYISETGKVVSDNGFAGNIEFKFYNYNPNVSPSTSDWASAHCVLQGFGSFAGQTLKLTFDGPNPTTQAWTGYCLKR